jgi:plastocyanin
MKRLTISLICVLTFIGTVLSVSFAMADDRRSDNVTVSFGLWNPNDPNLLPAEKPLDRLIADPGMGRGVNDILVPQKVTIKEGDTVNFIIGGGHVLTIYDDGTKPKDIDTSVTEPAERCPTTAGGVINDPMNRIYRGPCFSTNFGTTPSTTITRRDGVEVVQFTKLGTFLVICSRKNHFIDQDTQQFKMFGFVKVLPERKKD